MRSFLFITALLLTQALGAQTKKSTDTVHLRIKRLNDTYIDAYLKYPDAGKKVPLLIMCQGSGTGSMTAPFLAVTEQWNDKLGRLVVEKAGVGYGDEGNNVSTVYKENNVVQNRLYDYLRVLQYLRATANWWNGDVYVIGGSEGGLLAGMIASFYPDVKGVAILGFGGGLTFKEAWPKAIRFQKSAEGYTESQLQAAEQAASDTINLARSNPTYSLTYDGKDNTYAWWASIVDLRLVNSLTDLNIPIYMAHGSEDNMMPIASAKKVQELFTQKGKTNLLLKEYIGFDHGFTDKEGKSHYAKVFIDAISWMLKKK
jgi:dienelactone hydrolase